MSLGPEFTPEGGIDSQVQDRMDAYRNNPQKLKQNYGKNKELLDLMALQKLNKQKKDTAAAMQLAQEQDPGTIAQQREQEALAFVKAEMGGTLSGLIGRTSDTLGQQKKVQDKARGNVGKPAQGGGLAGLLGAKPPMRNPRAPTGNPAAQGLAGARMAQAAAQTGGPQRMAQGGIVGFAGDDGNNQVGTPGGRFLRGLGTGQTSEQKRRMELEKKVQEKYSLSSGLLGLGMTQTDAQREYAQAISETFRLGSSSLTTEQLQTYADAEFTPNVTMSTEDLSALPPVPTGDVPVETGESDGPTLDLNAGDTNAQLGTTTTYANRAIDPQSFLSAENLQLERVADQVEAVDSTDLEAAKVQAKALAGETADVDVLNIGSAPDVPELENVTMPYTDAEQANYDTLMAAYETDANMDSGRAVTDAQDDSDIYTKRLENEADFVRQTKELRDLQSRTQSPAQLASEARIRTLAGGRLGRGGMSQGYLDSMQSQRDMLGGGLKDLRGIDLNRINTDMSSAEMGARRGDKVLDAAENRRNSGLEGLRRNLEQSEKRALQTQELKSASEVADFNYRGIKAAKTFGALESVIQRTFEFAKADLASEDNQYLANVKVRIANINANNEQAAEAQELKLTRATKQADLAFKESELDLTNLVAMEKVLVETEAKAAELMILATNGDPAYINLRRELGDLNKAENPVLFAKKEAEIRVMFEGHKREQIERFSSIFGQQERLKDLIANLKAGTQLAGSDVTSMKELKTGSDFLADRGSPGYR